MNKQGSAGNTSTNMVRLHRVLAANPDKVYRAFTTGGCYGALAAAQRLHMHSAPDGLQSGRHLQNVIHKFRHRSKTHTFGGKYLDLVPDELIRYTDRFEDPNLLGEMITTVPVSVGTDVNIVQEGLPAAIPIEACYLAGSSRSITSLCSSSPRSRTRRKVMPCPWSGQFVKRG
jgi:uncharacterized protein YndB with AHSA1/START domain